MTMQLSHIRARRWLVQQAGGLLPPPQQRKLFRHMEVCGECHALYSAQLWAEQCGPAGDHARRARLERSLFGQAEAKPVSWIMSRRTWGLAGAASTCALLILVLVRLWPGDTFQDKGLSQDELSRHVSISAYKRTAGGEFTPVRETIRSRDQLAFAYSNTSERGLDHLLLFGVDERGTIYWYYPAWTDPSRNPSALPIRRGTGVELPEQVGHRYEGDQLRIFALFSAHGDLTVHTIEQTLQTLHQRGVRAVDLQRFPLPGSGQHSFVLKVVQP